MTALARLRGEINILDAPQSNAKIIDLYDTNSLVRILEDHGEYLKIKQIRLEKSGEGFAPRQGLIFPPAGQEQSIFPDIDLGNNFPKIPSVLPSLPLRFFLKWLGSGNNPLWISPDDWSQLDSHHADSIIKSIEAPIKNNKALWDKWVSGVKSAGRIDDAIMDEWMVYLRGGREMFTRRDYMIFDEPNEGSTIIGWTRAFQVLQWSGRIMPSNIEGRLLYEVDFYRKRKATHGWFRGDLLAEYNFPTEENDPDIASNKDHIFDLNNPILRHPRDPEFSKALQEKRSAAQYLDIREVTGRRTIHFNLCGEICASTLVGSDVIPVLKRWWESDEGFNAKRILNNPNQGTFIWELNSILNLYNLHGEIYDSGPVSAQFVKNKLDKGMFAISGCCISRGKVTRKATTKHWVIVEDVVPVGSSGWVRIYNPYMNKEEVYEYNTFLSSSFARNGLWVKV
jgi:hypothetical protein